MPTSNRAFFRLEYPAPRRPDLNCRAGHFSVMEISEEGVRIRISNSDRANFAIGREFEVEFYFGDDTYSKSQGRVLRLGEADGELYCALRLANPISTKRIFSEQRSLLRVYPRIAPHWAPE